MFGSPALFVGLHGNPMVFPITIAVVKGENPIHHSPRYLYYVIELLNLLVSRVDSVGVAILVRKRFAEVGTSIVVKSAPWRAQ